MKLSRKYVPFEESRGSYAAKRKFFTMARFTKVVFTAALVCTLCLPAVVVQFAMDSTGRHWLQSSQNEKLAFLYGASNTIAIEQLIAQQ